MYGSNAFPVQQLNLTIGHVPIVVELTIMLTTVLFIPLLHTLMVEDNQLLLTPNSDPPLLTLPYAVATTDQTVTVLSANMHTDVTTVVGHTRAKAIQEMGSSAIFKPLPWTPLRPFILKRELSYYPDKVFVRRLMYV